MHHEQRKWFFTALNAQFIDIFTTSKAGKDTTELRLRAQGFIHAGELLQLCSRSEIQELMDARHYEVFGCTYAQRKPKESERRQQALKQGDYDYFDEPAFNRLR
jgi:hypothetical protein